MGVNASIDLNAIQKPQTPITVEFSGVVSFFGTRDGFESDLAARLSAASLPPDSLSVAFPLFSAGFNGTTVVRTNAEIVNGAAVQYVVRAAITAASGNDAQGVTVIAIGKPGDVVTAPEQQGGLFPDFQAWFKKITDTLGSAVQWVIALLAIALVVYVLVVTGALKKGVAGGREAFA